MCTHCAEKSLFADDVGGRYKVSIGMVKFHNDGVVQRGNVRLSHLLMGFLSECISRDHYS